MLPAKLTLSAEERELMMNARFILTKNAVLKEMELFFGQLCDKYQEQVKLLGLSETAFAVIGPKISRGERYQQLPWIMLDYPRLFTKKNVCAIRCFFWWGKYWSITLHLAGIYLTQYEPVLLDFIKEKTGASDWYLSQGDDPWQHDLEIDYYTRLDVRSNNYSKEQRSYVKLVKKIPLDQWDQLFLLMEENYTSLLAILKDHQAPKR